VARRWAPGELRRRGGARKLSAEPGDLCTMADSVYTLDDVAEHAAKDDCWIVVSGGARATHRRAPGGCAVRCNSACALSRRAVRVVRVVRVAGMAACGAARRGAVWCGAALCRCLRCDRIPPHPSGWQHSLQRGGHRRDRLLRRAAQRRHPRRGPRTPLACICFALAACAMPLPCRSLTETRTFPSACRL
jgi:hypothetical protein